MCAGSRALCTTLVRSARTLSRSTAIGERVDGLVRVVTGPVEAPVDPVLHPPPHRVEQTGYRYGFLRVT
jgi:hypothetical protein